MTEAAGKVWHGGDLAQAKALFPEAPEPWIDLSTGINPIPYPVSELPLSLWQRLPGARDEAALLAAARQAYRVSAAAGIVAAPGTQILIELLPRLANAGAVAVLGPTYAEHALAWRKAGRAVHEIERLDDVGDAGVVVLVNPNNPDGRVIGREQLAALARSLATRGGLLVIDEAFIDFMPEASLIPDLPPATIVLRSFGKTYGLAGLRLGFAIGEPRLTEILRNALGPWAVAGPALHLGAQALGDVAWLAATSAARTQDAGRLDSLLETCGEVVGGTSLFRLLATPVAVALFAHLGRNGIYVRRFQNNVGWLRFGLPAGVPEWTRLKDALASFPPA